MLLIVAFVERMFIFKKIPLVHGRIVWCNDRIHSWSGCLGRVVIAINFFDFFLFDIIVFDLSVSLMIRTYTLDGTLGLLE